MLWKVVANVINDEKFKKAEWILKNTNASIKFINIKNCHFDFIKLFHKYKRIQKDDIVMTLNGFHCENLKWVLETFHIYPEDRNEDFLLQKIEYDYLEDSKLLIEHDFKVPSNSTRIILNRFGIESDFVQYLISKKIIQQEEYDDYKLEQDMKAQDEYRRQEKIKKKSRYCFGFGIIF